MAGVRGSAALLVVAASAVLLLAGCGDDPAPVATAPPASSGAVIPGGGLTVEEAIATDADPPLAVAGWIVATGDGTRLCSGYDAHADEPCLKPSLSLTGAESETSGAQVSLFGAVEGDTFVVSSTVQG